MAEELPQDDVLELEDQPTDDGDQPENIGDDDKSDSGAQDSKITEKRLKDTQAAYTRKSQEHAELQKKYAALEGKVDLLLQQSQSKPESKPENPFGFLDDEKEVETLLEDPKNVANAFKKVIGTLPDIFERRDKVLISEMRKMFGSVATDEGREVAAKVAKLRQDSEYDSFTDDQLTVLAKKSLKAQAVKKDKFKGGVGGSGGRVSRDGEGDDELEQLSNDYFKRLYGNSLDDPKK